MELINENNATANDNNMNYSDQFSHPKKRSNHTFTNDAVLSSTLSSSPSLPCSSSIDENRNDMDTYCNYDENPKKIKRSNNNKNTGDSDMTMMMGTNSQWIFTAGSTSTITDTATTDAATDHSLMDCEIDNDNDHLNVYQQEHRKQQSNRGTSTPTKLVQVWKDNLGDPQTMMDSVMWEYGKNNDSVTTTSNINPMKSVTTATGAASSLRHNQQSQESVPMASSLQRSLAATPTDSEICYNRSLSTRPSRPHRKYEPYDHWSLTRQRHRHGQAQPEDNTTKPASGHDASVTFPSSKNTTSSIVVDPFASSKRAKAKAAKKELWKVLLKR